MLPALFGPCRDCPQAVDASRVVLKDLRVNASSDLTQGEQELLLAAEDDDIDIAWALTYLGIRANDGTGPVRATQDEIEAGFRSLERLHDRGLISIGSMEYVDGGAPGRVSPVHHVSEPIDLVKQRVIETATASNDPAEWYFAAWIVQKHSET